jgi:sulfur carrier protein
MHRTPAIEESTGKSTSRLTDEARAMTVRVNDKSRAVADSTMLSQLLDELGLTGRNGVAVAVNDAVVPRSSWLTRPLADGDQVLVIQATQGG